MKEVPTRMGFEPTRAEHIGLAVQRLNHSATSSRCMLNCEVWNLLVCIQATCFGKGKVSKTTNGWRSL